MKKSYDTGDFVQHDFTGFRTEAPVDTTPDGYIAGTASTPSVDLAGHRVLKGAFDESIRLKGLTGPKSIKLLAFHNWRQPAGVIKKLETVGDDLKIGAQLNLNVSYVKDLHEIAKQNSGLNFSAGFFLEKFRFEEVKETKQEILVIEKGDLCEVSIVALPAQPDATMDFVKSAETPSEFEKLLMAEGWASNRREAHQLMQLCKRSSHLFGSPMLAPKNPPNHPMLDVSQLKAATDLTHRVKALLSR